jgi:hypothetical protein
MTMPSLLTRPFLPLLVLLCLCPAGVARAEPEAQDKPDKNDGGDAYAIKIARPVPVGTKYELKADGAMLRQVTLHVAGRAQKQPDDGFGVRLEGTVEVLALDDVGEESKVACTVDKCTRITSEGETELVPKGKVILAEGKGKDTKFHFQDDGKELSKQASDALELVISLDTGDTVSDDEMFGTKDKQKVGGEWPVTAEAVARDAGRVGVIVKPADVEGSFKLEGVEKVGNVDCVKLSGSLKMKKLLRKDDEDDGLPKGFTVTGGSMEARYGGLFPVDPDLGSLSESVSMTFLTNVKGKGGPANQEVTIESRVQRAGEIRKRYLK